MNVLKDVKITSFTQTIWVSDAAKQAWQKNINEINRMVDLLEVESVVAGHRRCAWRTMSRNEFPEFTKNIAAKGIMVYPVQFVGTWEGFIHHTPPGDTHVYCIISRNIEDAKKFKAAYDRGDHAGQGEMLGFPKCCCDAFARNWAAGYFDPIWQAAINTPGLKWQGELNVPNGRSPEEVADVAAHPFSNPVLRYIGLRYGFHIPCSFQCAETISEMEKRHLLAVEYDAELATLLLALLKMPMTWDVLHGIANITTPLFRVITNSIPTAEKYTVHIAGDYIPPHGIWHE